MSAKTERSAVTVLLRATMSYDHAGDRCWCEYVCFSGKPKGDDTRHCGVCACLRKIYDERKYEDT